MEEAARRAGLDIAVRHMGGSTRTAEDAARACGCEVGRIVKSLAFETAGTRRIVLLLVPGSERVDLERAAEAVGERLERADGRRVREETGFAIGGVAPIGATGAVATFMDEGLLVHSSVWAAAGTPNAVFEVGPRALAEASGATLAPLT